MTHWLMLNGFPFRGLGFLPDILMSEDKQPVRAQLEERYAHGGGWRPITGFRMNKTTKVLRFPGDSPFEPCAIAQFGDETVVFYRQCSILAVIQKDGSFEVTRVD